MGNIPPVVEQGAFMGDSGGNDPKKNGLHWGVWVGIGVVVCMAPVAILAAILFPVFSQTRIAATKTQALSVMQQNATAMAIYQADWDDLFPPDMSSVEAVVLAFEGSRAGIKLQAEVLPGEFLVPNAELSGMNALSDEVRLDTPVFTFESKKIPGGIFSSYVDGSARFEEFEER